MLPSLDLSDVSSVDSRKKKTFSGVGLGQESIPFLSTTHRAYKYFKIKKIITHNEYTNNK